MLEKKTWKMRIMLDTNILLSALIFGSSNLASLVVRESSIHRVVAVVRQPAIVASIEVAIGVVEALGATAARQSRVSCSLS
jgi:hypothetical protein